MNRKDQLTAYTNKLLKELKPNLKKDVQADFIIYPASGRGAVVAVELKRGGRQTSKPFTFKADASSVNEVLKTIPQRFVGGNIDAVQFSGTNISLEENRILFIKGDDEHWSESDAKNDILRAFSGKGGK